jgi:hypothetical protein
MMNKIKSAKLNLMRFLFMLPLACVLLLAFRKNQIATKDHTELDRAKNFEGPDYTYYSDTLPDEVNDKGFIVYVTGNKSNASVVVKDKTGKLLEKIPYEKWRANEKFYTDKYGEYDAPPPPPLPPTPPTPPLPIELPANVKRIDVNNKRATVVLKDGTEEKYDLNKPEEKAKFEKYGDVIHRHRSLLHIQPGMRSVRCRG